MSQTADEATHLFAGFRYLKCGDLTVSPEHPPLAKTVAAAPLVSLNFSVNCSPFQGNDVEQSITAVNWLYSQNWKPALARARGAASVFALGLCLLVWLAARRMFGFATAVVATMLLVFEPNVLAYGALVMTDIPVTCMMLFAVFAFYLWVGKRTVPFLLLTALATGLALLTKHSAVLLVPMLCALAITDALLGPSEAQKRLHAVLHNLVAVAMISALAVGVVWMGYSLDSGKQRITNPPNLLLPSSSFGDGVVRVVESTHLFPRAYLDGVAATLLMSAATPVSFVGGSIFPRAPWFSIPFYLSIRNTAAMLVLFLLAISGGAIAFRQHRREFLFLVIPVGIFLAACMRSSLAGGIRYLLPVFPFLLIAVAAGCVELIRRVQWARYAVPGLIFFHALSSLHAYPNYLSYANEFWGGPARAYKYLPWLDSGQAYIEAKSYLEKHPSTDCWLITGWQWDPALYGIPCHTFGLYLPSQIPPGVHGTVILSSTLLTDVRLPELELAMPFKGLVPKDKIGGSALLVYEGDFDTRLDASKSERDLMMRAYTSGQPSMALQHGRQALVFAPGSPLVHSDMCTLLSQLGQMDSAFNECSIALDLIRRDPLREEPARKKFRDSLEQWMSSTQAAARK
jgi:hypothetical protein